MVLAFIKITIFLSFNVSVKKENLGQMVFFDKGFFEPSHMMAAKWGVTMAINAKLDAL